MKKGSKMKNNINKTVLWHTTPEFILRDHDFCVNAVTDADTAKAGHIELIWSTASNGDGVRENGRIRMTVTVIEASEDELILVSAVIPASAFLNADIVKYRFYMENRDVSSEEYEAQISDAGKMPPLIVTEFYARPKGLGVTAYIEVMNPNNEPVDLYDYKMMAFPGGNLSVKELGVIYFADKPGEEIIAPHTLALLWPQYPRHHMLENGKYSSAEGFCEVINAEFPRPEFEVKPDGLKLVKVEFCRYDEETAEYVFKDGAAELPSKNEHITLLLVPREKEAGDAVYSMEYNKDDGCYRDTPVRHSSLWGIDIRNPAVGIVMKHKAYATPGRLSDWQSFPDFNVGYPAVYPASAGKELFSSSGEMKIAFDVFTGKACGAAVHLKTADGTFVERDAVCTGGGHYSAVFPEDITDRLEKLEYYITVYDGIRNSVLGSAGSLIETSVIDDKGPVITCVKPAEKYAYDNCRKPEISVEYFDVSGVDIGGSALFVDKKNVTAEAEWGPERVSYVPERPLRYGSHKLRIILKDKKGNETIKIVGFSVCRPDELELYKGEVHSHTADSDGIAGPDEAYDYARHVGGVDFFAVTEHSHYMTPEAYAEQIKAADRHDEPGRFAALYGWEMTWNNTCGLWGHLNILNSKWIVNDIRTNGIPEIYEKLKKDRGAVAMFNHPGLGWGNFLDFSNYSAEADRAVCLAEIKGAGYDHEYMDMLSRGWHASPAFNEDNHDFNWTTATKSTTYALAPALTRENILDAFRRRRTYSTSDPTMKIYYRVNGEWMGARLDGPESLDIDVKISTENERGIGSIALIAEDNIIVASVNAGALREYHWKLKLKPQYDYYYVRVTAAGQYTVTAPVWVEGNQPLSISKFYYNRGGDNYKPNVMTACIVNDSNSEIRRLQADFYLTPQQGFDIMNTVPYASFSLQDLAAGKSTEISCEFPDIAGLRRASVVVSGKCGKHLCGDTAAALLTPLRITEICAETSPVADASGNEIKNPYSYMQICNVSNRTVKLDGCYTRIWTATGKPPAEDKMLKLDGYQIPAGKTLTVWKKPKECTLTADDFNRHYGTALRENEELLISEVHFISSSKEARRLELICGNEILSRAEYNFGSSAGLDVVTDKAMVFCYRPNITGTSELMTACAEPSPAELRDELRQ